MNNGKFTEDFGRVEITLSTSPTALVFYEALKLTKSMQEVIVRLVWDPTKSNIQQCCDAILESDVSILAVESTYSNSPTSDVPNRGNRFHPFIQMIAKDKPQFFTIKDCPWLLDRISDFVPSAVPTLRVLHLIYNTEDCEPFPTGPKPGRSDHGLVGSETSP